MVFGSTCFSPNASSNLCKRLCKILARSKSYYITTPIYYVNSVPHIGHLYTTTLADASCRWQKLKQPHNQYTDSRLVTGTDEHGLKVKEAATAKGLKPLDFCDTVSERFSSMVSTFSIDAYDFVRTTEQRHHDAVQHFWQAVESNGFIYKGTYKGWYSIPDEAFVSESGITTEKDKNTGMTHKISKQSGHRLHWMEEENYKFKLSEFQDQLRDWLLAGDKTIHPARFKTLLLHDLEQPLEDLSISRHKSKVPWGIPVPGDDSHRVYVWFDALVNYLTAAGYPNASGTKFDEMWPADVHVVGQDILRFHAIYWPAFLMAAGLRLPKQVVVHGHWLYDNSKMSKSKGNVVDPFDLANEVTAEGLRYFLLRQGVISDDCNFSEWLLRTVLNSDLANDLGNCLHRILSKKVTPEKVYPHCEIDTYLKHSSVSNQYVIGDDIRTLVEQVRSLPHVVEPHFDDFLFYKGIGEIVAVVQKVNVILTTYKLFKLNRSDPQHLAFINTVLYCCCESIRVCSILLQPMVPNLAKTALDKLGVADDSRNWDNAVNSFPSLNGRMDEIAGRRLGPSKPVLFARLQVPSATTNAETETAQRNIKNLG